MSRITLSTQQQTIKNEKGFEYAYEKMFKFTLSQGKAI